MMTPSKKKNQSIASPRRTGKNYRQKQNVAEIENLAEASKHIAGVMTGIKDEALAANTDDDDAATLCTARLKTCSEEALRQKQEVESLVKSTQNMADIIAELGIFEQSAAPNTPAQTKQAPLDEHDMETPLVANTKLNTRKEYQAESPNRTVQDCTSECSSPAGEESQSTAVASPTSSSRQNLYDQLQTEKDQIEQKLMQMAMLFDLNSSDEEDMYGLLNSMELPKNRNGAEDIDPTAPTDQTIPPLDPILEPACSSSDRSASLVTTIRELPVSPKTRSNEKLQLSCDTALPEDESGMSDSVVDEDTYEPKFEVATSSVSSEMERSHTSVGESHSSVSYSDEVLKQQHAVDDLVRSTEAMAEALRELEKAQSDGDANGNTSSPINAISPWSTGNGSSGSESPASSEPVGFSVEALQQQHAVDDLVRNTESMAEALKELERAQHEQLNFDASSDDCDLYDTALQKARNAPVYTNGKGTRGLLRSPRGARISRRKKRHVIEIMIWRFVSPLRRYPILYPILIAFVIAMLSPSQPAKGWQKTNPPLLQQLAKETCAKFTV